VHDVILFYTKGENYTWNPTYQAYEEEYLKGQYRFQDDKGRYTLDRPHRSWSIGREIRAKLGGT
jgi:hypothetical protein